MKFKQLSIMVTKLRLLVRLHYNGVSQRQISSQLDLSRTSIKAYLTRLLESGKSQEELEQLDDGSLLCLSRGEIYKQLPDRRYEFLKPLLSHYAKESKRPYVTIQLLWEEYLDKFQDDAYSYTTFKRHLQEYVKSHTYSYHNTHVAGRVLQADFAGDALYTTDLKTGIKTPVVILCCTLPCSGLSFLYALPDACMDNLFYGLSLCLSYIGGVPATILSDNMKQWVKKRDKDGPVFTDAALEFGLHYSTQIDATGVRKPKHKASVEGSIHIMYERIYAKVRDDVFFSLNELNSRLFELLEEFNVRKMKNRKYSRREYFEANERNSLAAIPAELFTIKYTRECKVGSNYHIYIATHQYSVPYDYVNQVVSIVYDQQTVEIYDSNYARISLHRRSYKRYGYTTNKEHMPANHIAYEHRKGARNAASYLYRGNKIDIGVENIIHMVLDNAACIEQAYTSCEAILQLHKLDPTAFIDSCKYAQEHLSVVNYKIIKQIMNNKRYTDPLKKSEDPQILHTNLRGKEAFLN